MTFPKHSSSETKVFHPYFENAFRSALTDLGIDKLFDLEHHPRLGADVPDFILKESLTNQIVLIIEIKRSRSDAESNATRSRAQSYVVNSLSRIKEPFFLVTNLEIIDLQPLKRFSKNH